MFFNIEGDDIQVFALPVEEAALVGYDLESALNLDEICVIDESVFTSKKPTNVTDANLRKDLKALKLILENKGISDEEKGFKIRQIKIQNSEYDEGEFNRKLKEAGIDRKKAEKLGKKAIKSNGLVRIGSYVLSGLFDIILFPPMLALEAFSIAVIVLGVLLSTIFLAVKHDANIFDIAKYVNDGLASLAI